MRWTETLLLALLVSLTACGKEDGPPKAAPATPRAGDMPPAAVIELNNEGAALMGRFDYEAATRTLQQVVERAPKWERGRVNLAIATLNRQQPGDEDRALALLDDVLSTDPGQLEAHYLSGILEFNRGNAEAALGHFERVAEADPGDAYAAYFTGQCLLQLGQLEPAAGWFDRAMSADPYLRSAYYGAFLVRQRVGDRDAARALLEQYQKLDGNPRSRMAEIKYTRMGPKAMARSIMTEPAAAPEAVKGPLFSPREDWIELAAETLHGASVWRDGAGDYRLMIHHDRRSTVIDTQTGQVDDAAPPFAAVGDVLLSAWGDVDNDGRLDVYLGREGPNQLWMQREEGWEEVSARAGLDDVGTARDAFWLDADHDGDLDLLLANQKGHPELYNNDGDGSFRPLAGAEDLAADPAPVRQLLATDLDGDLDLDLVDLREDGRVNLYRNDRLWQYRRDTLASPTPAPLMALARADLDVDGRFELLAVDREGARWMLAPEANRWIRRSDAVVPLKGETTGITLQDVNGDGQPELMAWDAGRWWLDGAQPHPGRWVALLNDDVAGGPSVVDWVDGVLGIHRPGAGRHRFVGLDLAGADDPGQSMRSNYAAIGTRYVLRAGPVWAAGMTLRRGSGPGQDAQPTLVGLGGQDQVEALELDWPDGVFQTEMSLSAGRLHHVVETQRQLASCPVVFAWDGERHRFVSDVLGVAGLGFATGPGEYATPRPWEAFALPEGLLRPRDGRLEVLITEPMEEIAYLDRVRLVAIDHPADRQLILDERMATGGPEPTGDPILFRKAIHPHQVLDGQGDDHGQAALANDRVAVPPGDRDRRFLGLLAEPLQLELRFEDDLSGMANPVLLMAGWVEYGYSQTSFAAWQAGIGYQPPTLEAWTPERGWWVVAERFGYPAGMPRIASLPLPALPEGTRRLRLHTNQEIYFDELAVVSAESDPKLQRWPLGLDQATVRRIGFPRRSDGPQRQPSYDFEQRVSFWDTRYPTGAYTALGEATELVAEADNALAIIGPGDALILRFLPPDSPPAPGWARRYVLYLDGWAKDMDRFTRDSGRVGPLPMVMARQDRSETLHQRYNTRFQSGR